MYSILLSAIDDPKMIRYSMETLECILYLIFKNYTFEERFGSKLDRFLIFIVLEIPYVFPEWFHLKISQC